MIFSRPTDKEALITASTENNTNCIIISINRDFTEKVLSLFLFLTASYMVFESFELQDKA